MTRIIKAVPPAIRAVIYFDDKLFLSSTAENTEINKTVSANGKANAEKASLNISLMSWDKKGRRLLTFIYLAENERSIIITNIAIGIINAANLANTSIPFLIAKKQIIPINIALTS